MGMFNAIDAGVSGATVSKVWLDAISDNVANLNTVRPAGQDPFRARMVVVSEKLRTGGAAGGAEVTQILSRPGDPEKVYDPTNPLADERGYITRPNVDLGVEMTNMLIAQRSYQANLRTVEQARDMYRSALQIGARQ
jgi:flagellar basal-body rod protein FlgC